MKNIFKVALFAASLYTAGQAQAQTTHKDTTFGQKVDKTAKKVGKSTAKTAKKVGNTTSDAAKDVGKKTSEVAAKGAAAVVDKKYDGVVSPTGQTVYINDKSQYYYVNKKGHRVYLKKSELITKP
jgi:hypothetical protein